MQIGALRKKQQVEEKKYVFVDNDSFINIIQPCGVSFHALGTSLGENVGKIYCISRYAEENDYGWLANLCNLEGTSTVIQFRYTDSSSLIKIYDRRINELISNRGTLKNPSDIEVNEKRIEDLSKLVKRLAVQQEPVGYVNVLLHIQDINEDRLAERIKRVRGKIAVYGCDMILLKDRQGKALKQMAPYGIPNDDDVFNVGMRNMPISTFFGGFPMANTGLNDDGGYYLGKTTENRLVILNPWLRGKDRVNSNWVILGPPGIGKSTVLKDILLSEYAYGTKIIILDPEEEYVDMVRHPDVNGSVVGCSGGSKGRINPLQARKTAVVRREDLEEGENEWEYLFFDEHNGISDLAMYIQQLKVFFTLYFGKEEFTASISTNLEKCLIELYQDFGITWETDIEKIPNEKWPIFEDLAKKVESKIHEEGISEYRKNNLEKLSDLLYSAAYGSDSMMWNGPTTLEADADFVDLVISFLLECSDKVKRAQFYNIVSWAWTELSNDRKKRVLFAVDEGHTVVDPDYPDIMKYLKNMAKRLRKYEGALMFITHSLVDILDPAVKRYGQAIIDSACYKLIMGCDGKNLEETVELFNLSEKEINLLNQKERGKGILMAGSTRLSIKVDVSDDFLEIMGSAGGR